MENRSYPSLLGSSATPGLEGAPCSRSHEGRCLPASPPPEAARETGKEESPSKP